MLMDYRKIEEVFENSKKNKDIDVTIEVSYRFASQEKIPIPLGKRLVINLHKTLVIDVELQNFSTDLVFILYSTNGQFRQEQILRRNDRSQNTFFVEYADENENYNMNENYNYSMEIKNRLTGKTVKIFENVRYNAIPKLLVSPIFWENNVFNLYTGLNFNRFVSEKYIYLIKSFNESGRVNGLVLELYIKNDGKLYLDNIQFPIPVDDYYIILSEKRLFTNQLVKERSSEKTTVISALNQSVKTNWINNVIRERIIVESNIVRRSSWSNITPRYFEMELDWNYTDIAIHHSGDYGRKDPKDIENLHVERNKWPDIGYHYLIHPSGIIYEGTGIIFKGSHIGNKNTGKIGIIVLGDFEHQWWDIDDIPTRQQLTSLVDLIYCLRKYFPIIHLGGHRDWTSTECPGTELYKRLPNIRQQVDLIAP
jgi:hypothetical protein